MKTEARIALRGLSIIAQRARAGSAGAYARLAKLLACI